MTPTSPADLRTEDWLLIGEALLCWSVATPAGPAGINDGPDSADPRQQRAYAIAEAIAEAHDLPPRALMG